MLFKEALNIKHRPASLNTGLPYGATATASQSVLLLTVAVSIVNTSWFNPPGLGDVTSSAGAEHVVKKESARGLQHA